MTLHDRGGVFQRYWARRDDQTPAPFWFRGLTLALVIIGALLGTAMKLRFGETLLVVFAVVVVDQLTTLRLAVRGHRS